MATQTWLGKEIDKDKAVTAEPLVVSPRHNSVELNTLTKKQVVAYAHLHGIAINTRKKKEELIDIIVRS